VSLEPKPPIIDLNISDKEIEEHEIDNELKDIGGIALQPDDYIYDYLNS